MTFALTCERAALLNALVLTGRAVGRPSAQPAICLELSGGRLTATGSDRDLTISTELAVGGGSDGVVVAPAKLLPEVVRALDGDEVTLAHDGESSLTVEAGRARFQLRTYGTEQFQQIAEPVGAPVRLAPQALGEALWQVVRAASTDESRPVLQGVLVEATARGARLVATDSYRLAVRDLDGVGFLGEGQRVIVPGRALGELQRLLSDEPVEVCLGEKEVRFGLGATRLSARLIDGEFPPYGQILPAPGTLPKRLTVDREALLAMLRRVRLLAPRPEVPQPVQLALSPGTLKATLAVPELGQAVEELEAKYEGEDMVIAFNPAYLADGVEPAGGDEVVVEMGDPVRPAVVKSRDNGDFFYVLMPVRI
jgi:DNA polymerase-3 subunit beta